MKKFRECLGSFATGVTVVTCRGRDGQACGVTANSFSSVSLDPPLILWNIGKVSRSLSAYLAAEYFVVNVLAWNQKDLATRFAISSHGLFDDIDIDISTREVPVLRGTIATLDCRTLTIHDSGDHHTIVGEVLSYHTAPGDPLLFFRGRYCAVHPDL